MPLRRIFYVSLAIPTSMGLFSVPAFATTYVPQGTYNTNVTWNLAGSPYVIQSTLSIGNGATLTIEPGVIVKFGQSGNTDRIDVLGTLLVGGTSGEHVTFTSLEDDSIGGDTGGDGQTQGAPSQWKSINVWGLAFFQYTDIRYGGAGKQRHSIWGCKHIQR